MGGCGTGVPVSREAWRDGIILYEMRRNETGGGESISLISLRVRVHVCMRCMRGGFFVCACV